MELSYGNACYFLFYAVKAKITFSIHVASELI